MARKAGSLELKAIYWSHWVCRQEEENRQDTESGYKTSRLSLQWSASSSKDPPIKGPATFKNSTAS